MTATVRTHDGIKLTTASQCRYVLFAIPLPEYGFRPRIVQRSGDYQKLVKAAARGHFARTVIIDTGGTSWRGETIEPHVVRDSDADRR